MSVVDHPRTTPAPAAHEVPAAPVTDSNLTGSNDSDEPTDPTGSPLERGTKLAVQASLRYRGRMSMGTARTR
jgi:hypothetical protein